MRLECSECFTDLLTYFLIVRTGVRVVRVRKSRDAIWLNTFPKDRASDSAAAPCKPLRDLCSNSAAVAVAVGRCDKSHVEVDAQDREELAASI